MFLQRQCNRLGIAHEHLNVFLLRNWIPVWLTCVQTQMNANPIFVLVLGVRDPALLFNYCIPAVVCTEYQQPVTPNYVRVPKLCVGTWMYVIQQRYYPPTTACQQSLTPNVYTCQRESYIVLGLMYVIW